MSALGQRPKLVGTRCQCHEQGPLAMLGCKHSRRGSYKTADGLFVICRGGFWVTNTTRDGNPKRWYLSSTSDWGRWILRRHGQMNAEVGTRREALDVLMVILLAENERRLYGNQDEEDDLDA